VQVVIYTHPPHATIVQPAANTNFDKALYVLATDPDLDVGSVSSSTAQSARPPGRISPRP
jgi:hypothetical protein